MNSGLQLMTAIYEIGERYRYSDFDIGLVPQQSGWVTSARVREHVGANSLETRNKLKHLSIEGYLETEVFEQVNFFRLSALGHEIVRGPDELEPIRAKASDWTGIVEPIQVRQILSIVSEIEDVAEKISDNAERSQILGLVLALKTLLDLPNPPRQGVVALVRDPAFSNIVQIGTFLAAIIAALRS